MRTALITVAHQRHQHLARQQLMLQRSGRRPDHRIIVAIDDPDISPLVSEDNATVIEIPGAAGGLPVGAARNVGATAALAGGAELLVFLDVDCLPSPQLLSAYLAAASAEPSVDTLWCGPVAYLPPPPPAGYDLDQLGEHPFHPARPAPPPGTVQHGGDHRLFWSLSFAVTAPVWQRLGGFCERYQGYGAEDTDLGVTAASKGIGVSWVGGADAFHQWHPAGSPPLRHLDDILRNGAVFAERWGWWPMQGWLDQFAELGLVRRDDRGGWQRVAAASQAQEMVKR